MNGSVGEGGYIGEAGQVSDNLNVNKWMNVCKHLRSTSLSVVLFSIVHHALIPCVSLAHLAIRVKENSGYPPRNPVQIHDRSSISKLLPIPYHNSISDPAKEN
jgi:hypothetical protein